MNGALTAPPFVKVHDRSRYYLDHLALITGIGRPTCYRYGAVPLGLCPGRPDDSFGIGNNQC